MTGRNAVVADDDPEMRSLMSTVLKNAGFEVTEAPDGCARLHAEALRLGASAVLDKPFSIVSLRELALCFGNSDLLSA